MNIENVCISKLFYIISYSLTVIFICCLSKWNRIDCVEIHLYKRLARKIIQRCWSKQILCWLCTSYENITSHAKEKHLSTQGCSEYLNALSSLGQWNAMWHTKLCILQMAMWSWWKKKSLVKREGSKKTHFYYIISHFLSDKYSATNMIKLL